METSVDTDLSHAKAARYAEVETSYACPDSSIGQQTGMSAIADVLTPSAIADR